MIDPNAVMTAAVNMAVANPWIAKPGTGSLQQKYKRSNKKSNKMTNPSHVDQSFSSYDKIILPLGGFPYTTIYMV